LRTAANGASEREPWNLLPAPPSEIRRCFVVIVGGREDPEISLKILGGNNAVTDLFFFGGFMANAFQKELKLSEELQEVVGAKKASRGMVMKGVWKYIKKKGLNEGRIISPKDSKLEPILGKKPLDMFKMVKLLSKHIDV
jgi:chromatin remodeling complex protein RSC6